MTVDLTDSDGCGKYKFICARVRKDSPTPDYKLVGKDQSAIVGCAPVTCESRYPVVTPQWSFLFFMC